MIPKERACTTTLCRITAADLPLSCPLPNQLLWDAHPRVYLAIEESPGRKIECPYCSTYYELIEE